MINILRVGALALLMNPVSAYTVPETIPEKVVFYADFYHIDLDSYQKTIECESGFDPSVQSGYYHKDGRREESYGLAQINLPAHPSVTKEEALDPDFSLRWMAEQFSVGNQRLWACYTQLKKSGKIQ